jgi:hypothetical protein
LDEDGQPGTSTLTASGLVRGNIWLSAVPAAGEQDPWTHGVAE